MMVLLALAAAVPQIPQRVDAALPSAWEETEGLIDDLRRLEYDPSVFSSFDDLPAVQGIEEERRHRIDDAVADLIGQVEEERDEPPAQAAASEGQPEG